MDLSFLQDQEEQIKKNLVRRFKEHKLETLDAAPPTELVCPDGVSYLQESLYNYLIFMGLDTTQKVKAIIVENMSDDLLYQYLYHPDRLDNLLKKTLSNMKNKKLSCIGFDNILTKLNLIVRMED